MNGLWGAQDGKRMPPPASKRSCTTHLPGEIWNPPRSRLLSHQVSVDGLSQPDRPNEPVSEGRCMNSIIYLIGLIVVVLAILSFLGLR